MRPIGITDATISLVRFISRGSFSDSGVTCSEACISISLAVTLVSAEPMTRAIMLTAIPTKKGSKYIGNKILFAEV